MRLLLFGASALAFMCSGCEGTATPAQASNEGPNGDTGRLVWAAFACSMYAEMAGKPEEQARLFRVGYDSGTRFVDGVRAKSISEEEVRNKVPIGVIGAMSGPTTDFALGRIYEVATAEAYDRVVKKDNAGFDLPIKDWIQDDEVTKIRAGTQYATGNCSLLK